ncbi:hypothetical protein P43SY_009137 [Pythium insidiosum]|uniref:Uncharacterized protein n=1 Tax=Pythium insidiosum TaxID=114742 RepID=A0AAD5LJE2_PYTIN|nr:hypothetical protein P43SY_009137 [Pythium insidiosum]
MAAAGPPGATSAVAASNGSYYEEYMRSNALRKHGSDRSAKQLLTDRNAYISFLEVQLERVSAACLSAQTVERRLSELEAAQIANDQKLSSLSKVFRLNQEYMEQTADQARADLTAFANKVDSWMDKYATDVAAHETRLTQCEEQLRRCDDVLTSVRDETQREFSDATHSIQRDVDAQQTLLFAVETRIENMQLEHQDIRSQMDRLHEVVNERVETDLEQFRTTLSEKAMSVDQMHEQLLRNEAISDMDDVRALLRKCLDAQHLLSASVVSLERDVDVASVGATRHRVDLQSDVVGELKENQTRLRDALRAVQSCARDAAERSDLQCERLADRLEAAEEQFARLAHEALERADTLSKSYV